MGIVRKIKALINVPEDDEEYEDDVPEEEYDEYDDYLKSDDKSTRQPRTASNPNQGNRVVNIHTTAQLQVVLVKPDKFDSAKEIADHLNNKRTVVVNLESAAKDVARRLVDFLSGVAYANDGQIKRVAVSTFIITPYNVDVMGDLIEEIENNSVFF